MKYLNFFILSNRQAFQKNPYLKDEEKSPKMNKMDKILSFYGHFLYLNNVFCFRNMVKMLPFDTPNAIKSKYIIISMY